MPKVVYRKCEVKGCEAYHATMVYYDELNLKCKWCSTPFDFQPPKVVTPVPKWKEGDEFITI